MGMSYDERVPKRPFEPAAFEEDRPMGFETGCLMGAEEEGPIRAKADGRAAVLMELLMELCLESLPESVGVARAEVRRLARLRGVSGQDAERVVLLTSELCTNALKHGAGRLFRLLVIQRDDGLRIEVHDTSLEFPTPRDAGADDESGRGYLLIGLLSDDHGSYLTTEGKAVWFECTVVNSS
jgi:anti-sigma regulatory factor (Ser/Thr protein kinase)